LFGKPLAEKPLLAFGVRHKRAKRGFAMAHLAGNYDDRQEFWKPAIPTKQEPLDAESTGQICERCGSDFLVGSRFCHICGANRRLNLSEPTGAGFRDWLDFASLRDALGQSTGSLTALFLGVACIAAAVVTGLLYTETTVLDWQAVQIWRVEWLLAALAMFAGGILLKKK
jgi:hypothetical protein